MRALGAAAPLQATAGPGGVGCAWGDRVAVGLAPRHPAPWPGCRSLCGDIGTCRWPQGPEADLPADRQLCPRPGAAETGAHLPRQERRWGGLRIAAVRRSAWGKPATAPPPRPHPCRSAGPAAGGRVGLSPPAPGLAAPPAAQPKALSTSGVLLVLIFVLSLRL